ncbi:putative lipoprotein [Escherichia coli]|uniref:Uncharacterized lipoprotein YsaB n=1 Tax=Escherichia coli TaxID=562 RepID=A0A485J785_ECOLX|nr:putative lipoprotein [Escherichia coli]
MPKIRRQNAIIQVRKNRRHAFEQFQGSYEMRGYTFRKEQFVCSFDADGHFLHLSMR